MDIGGYLSQGMKRMGGGDWASAHCLEKIQEMLSRAIKDQEDVWNMLLAASSTSTSSELLQQQGPSAGSQQELQLMGSGCGGGGLEAAAAAVGRCNSTSSSTSRQQQNLYHDQQQQLDRQQTVMICSSAAAAAATELIIPARNLRPLTAKVENSLDWCHLALCRIKEFTAQSPRSTQPVIKQQLGDGATSCMQLLLRYPKLDNQVVRSRVDQQPISSNNSLQQQQQQQHPCKSSINNSKPNILQAATALSPLQIPPRDTPLDQVQQLSLDVEITPGYSNFPRDSSSLKKSYSFVNNPRADRRTTSSTTTLVSDPSDHDHHQAAGHIPADQSTLSMLASDLEPRQGQNFEGDQQQQQQQQLPAAALATSTGMDTMDTVVDWSDFQEDDSVMLDMDQVPAACDNKDRNLLTASVTSKAAAHHHQHHHPRHLQQLSPVLDDHDLQMGAAADAAVAAAANREHHFQPQQQQLVGTQDLNHDNCNVDLTCGRPLASAHVMSRQNSVRAKRDREDMSAGTGTAADQAQKALVVTYQRLRPGVDIRKGIPEDGHRGWKKYGSKSIQNANFCRGYYKCSVKECSAKKSVQPTDNDPSVFQITYTGTHTCHSTNPRRKTHRMATTTVLQATAKAPTSLGQLQVQQQQQNHLRKPAQLEYIHESSPPSPPPPKISTPSHEAVAASTACQQKEPKPPPPVAPVPSEKGRVEEEEAELDRHVCVARPVETADNATSLVVVDLPGLVSTQASVRDVVAVTNKQKAALVHQSAATGFSSLSELAATAAADQQQLTSCSDLESLADSRSTTDSSMSQAAAAAAAAAAATAAAGGHDDQEWKFFRYALDQVDEQDSAVDVARGIRMNVDHDIDSYILSCNVVQQTASNTYTGTGSSSAAGGGGGIISTDELQGGMSYNHEDLHFVNQLHNADHDSDFENFQESMLQEWREVIMDSSKFSLAEYSPAD